MPAIYYNLSYQLCTYDMEQIVGPNVGTFISTNNLGCWIALDCNGHCLLWRRAYTFEGVGSKWSLVCRGRGISALTCS